MSNSTGNTLLALLAGAAVGAGIGILFAPDKGSKTRQKLKEGFENEKDNLKEKLKDVSETIKNKTAKVKVDLESEFENLISQTDFQKEEIIEALERRLAELKKQTTTNKK